MKLLTSGLHLYSGLRCYDQAAVDWSATPEYQKIRGPIIVGCAKGTPVRYPSGGSGPTNFSRANRFPGIQNHSPVDKIDVDPEVRKVMGRL